MKIDITWKSGDDYNSLLITPENAEDRIVVLDINKKLEEQTNGRRNGTRRYTDETIESV